MIPLDVAPLRHTYEDNVGSVLERAMRDLRLSTPVLDRRERDSKIIYCGSLRF
jgi:hypothetical protein